MKIVHTPMNTLRNQILVVFLLVMAIVLLIVGITTYHLVSKLLKDNAEVQIQQTAAQAIGRMETLYRQLDMLTNQVVTNTDVQQVLLRESEGIVADFNRRQTLMQIISSYQVYSDGIIAMELYNKDSYSLMPLNDTPLEPLDAASLVPRVESKWIEQADRAKGRMVWLGKDPKNEEAMLAIRRVSLMNRWFSSGGYLLIRINKDYFDLSTTSGSQDQGYTALIDQNGDPIFSNYDGDIQGVLKESSNVTLAGQEYIVVSQHSDVTNWALIRLTPTSSLTQGISVLRTAILISGGIGYLIFVVFSVLLSTMITRPILKLIKTMRSARLGELKPSPEVNSAVEITELTKTYNQMVAHMNELIGVIYEKELLRSRTELKALQAQINPHFLYNTLDALYWSLVEQEQEQLAELVVEMSELFRYTIGSAKEGVWVTLKEELEHIERYMHLMKLRFGDRLTWNITAPDECARVQIPKLLIQPLVENAILHGIGNQKGPGSVSISIERSFISPNWVITIADDGTGMDKAQVERIYEALDKENESVVSSKEGSGMAIVNVSKRLKLYYRESIQHGIHIDSEPGQGTTITFEIPEECDEL